MMKSILTLIGLLCGLVFCANAQTSPTSAHKIFVRIGPEVLFPVGTTAELNGISPGVSLQGAYQILPQLELTLSAMAVSVPPSKLYRELWEPWYATKFKNSLFFPVKAGGRYQVLPRLFVAAQAGASIPKDSFREVSFAYEAGLGTSFKCSGRSAFEIAAKYEAWALNAHSVTSFLGLRAAYSFGF